MWKVLCFWNRPVRNCLIHAWSMLPSSEVTLLERLVYFMSVLLLLSIALMNLVSWLQTEPWILEKVTLTSPPSLRDWTLLPFLMLTFFWKTEVTAVMVNSSLDQATQDKEALKAWESARRAKQNFGCSETRAVGATLWDLWFTKVFLYWTSVPSIAKL